jgi:hypothetical protein
VRKKRGRKQTYESFESDIHVATTRAMTTRARIKSSRSFPLGVDLLRLNSIHDLSRILHSNLAKKRLQVITVLTRDDKAKIVIASHRTHNKTLSFIALTRMGSKEGIFVSLVLLQEIKRESRVDNDESN